MSEISFAEKVWKTLRAHDVSAHITNKEVEFKSGKKAKFGYLPWASAWEMVMESFPESDFEFDPPSMFDGTGGEQWITINIRQGENTLTRRWWLPFLNQKNEPVAAPTSMQINTTRMRVLVKGLAMCGLGLEVYTGEDLPTGVDSKVQGTSVVASVLADIEVDWVSANGHVSTIKSALFNEDDPGLRAAIDALSRDSDLKVAVWSKLDSKERSYIKKAMKADE